MKHLRVLAALLAAVVLVAGISGQAEAQKKKKKGKRRRPTIGKLVSVDIKDGKGTITVQKRRRKKKGADAKRETVKFEVNAETKVLKRAAKKKAKAEPAEVSDLAVGQNVAVVAREGVAVRIVILARRKKGAE